MKLRGKGCILLAGCGMFMLAGCGKSTENLDAGMTAIQELRYEDAMSCFELATLNGEDEELICRGRGIACIGMSDYEQAISYLTQSLKNSDGHITPLEYDTNQYLALAFSKATNYQEAIRTYSAIIKMDPKNTYSYYGRGISYLKTGDISSACNDFDQAVSLEPKNYSLYIDIYSILSECDYKDMGTKYLQVALEADEHKISDFDHGRIFYYLEDYTQALTYFDAAKRSSGGEAYLYLGKTYEALGDNNYASSVYLSYLDENPDAAEVCNQLGMCKMKMEDYDEALSYFERGISIGDTALIQSLKLNEIIAYEYLGEFSKAKSLMENYLSLYPDDENAKREYSFLQSRS